MKLAPAIDWPAYFEAMGIVAPEAVIVCQPDFIAVSRLFTELPLEIHKSIFALAYSERFFPLSR